MRVCSVLLVCCYLFASLDARALMSMPIMRRNSLPLISPSNDGIVKRDSGRTTYMYGALNTTFDYYTVIQIGSKKQMFTVLVDTGSAATAIPVLGCKEYTSDVKPDGKECAHADAFYDSSESSTYKEVPCSDNCKCTSNKEACEFQLLYGDRSFLAGKLMEDELYIAGLSASVVFGGIEIESKGFAGSALDGIMGLAYHALDTLAGDDVFGKLVEANNLENAFSMCLGYSGGVLTLGGMDPRFSDGDVSYTPIVKELYYIVNMTDIMVDSIGLGLNSKVYNENFTIVDSGTTLFGLNQQAYEALVAVFQRSFCPKFSSDLKDYCYPDSKGNSMFTPGLCIGITREQLAQMPTIYVVLDGVKPLPLTPEQYFVQMNEYYCFGISPMRGIGAILGDVFMQAYNIEFDRANKRIGFAKVKNCTGAPVTISIKDGNNQQGNLGFSLATPLSVLVKYDDNELPGLGLIVQFEAVQGTAEFSNGGRAVTDENGVASMSVSLKTTGPVQIKATVLGPNASVTFDLTGSATLIIIIAASCVGAVLLIMGLIVGIVLYRRYRKQMLTNLQELEDEKESLLS